MQVKTRDDLVRAAISLLFLIALLGVTIAGGRGFAHWWPVFVVIGLGGVVWVAVISARAGRRDHRGAGRGVAPISEERASHG